jgi:hypothetical protein
MLAGIYLSEYDADSVLAAPVRFVADVLAGVPSIVVGILGYELVVVPMGTLQRLGRERRRWGSSWSRSSPARRKRCSGSCRTVIAKRRSRWGRPNRDMILGVVIPSATGRAGDRRDAGDRPRGGRNGSADLHRRWGADTC